MFYRLLLFFIIITCTSCTNGLSSKTNTLQGLDTIVDFSKVDVSPYFKICEKLLKKEKTHCFRTNIQLYFIKKLKKLELSSEQSINEMITVVLLVDKKGKTSLQELTLTDNITVNFPDFENEIHQMVDDLPQLYPALKRGIPVTTEYKLPINIKVQ